MVLKYPDLPEDEIVAIIGFDFIGDCYILHFEHNNGKRSWATINDAQNWHQKWLENIFDNQVIKVYVKKEIASPKFSQFSQFSQFLMHIFVGINFKSD